MRSEFEAVMTRKRFCDAVGIHATTLRRWEQAGHVNPVRQSVLGIETMVFEDEDVKAAKRAAKLLASHPGVLSVSEAFRRARGS